MSDPLLLPLPGPDGTGNGGAEAPPAGQSPMPDPMLS